MKKDPGTARPGKHEVHRSEIRRRSQAVCSPSDIRGIGSIGRIDAPFPLRDRGVRTAETQVRGVQCVRTAFKGERELNGSGWSPAAKGRAPDARPASLKDW